MAVILTTPILASAAIVPCGTSANPTPCTPCHFWELADRFIDFFLLLSLPILTVVLLYGGVLWLISSGNSSMVEKGKKIIWNGLVGVLIAFCGWLIVDSIIKTLASGKPVAAWNTAPICEAAVVAPPPGPPPPPPVVTPTPPPPPPGPTVSDAQARQQFSAAGITWNANCPQTCFNGIQQAAINEAISLKQQCPACVVQITGGTEGGHSETGSCTHINGCKFDISGNNTTLNNFITSRYTARAPTFGVAQYVAPDGSIYTREANGSWDVSIR